MGCSHSKPLVTDPAVSLSCSDHHELHQPPVSPSLPTPLPRSSPPSFLPPQCPIPPAATPALLRGGSADSFLSRGSSLSASPPPPLANPSSSPFRTLPPSSPSPPKSPTTSSYVHRPVSFQEQVTTLAPSCSSVLASLRVATLPPPSSSSRSQCGRLVASATISVFEYIVTTSGEYAPFAAVAVALCAAALSSYRALRTNDAARQDIVELLAVLSERLPAYMELFGVGGPSEEGPGAAQAYALKLLDVSFVAFRLADELLLEEGGGVKEQPSAVASTAKTVLRFLRARDASGALKECRRMLFEGVGMIAFMFGGAVSSHEIRLKTIEEKILADSLSKSSSSRSLTSSSSSLLATDPDPKCYLNPLRTLSEVPDAASFWDEANGFGPHAPVKLVVKSLLSEAVKYGFLAREKVRGDVDKFEHYRALRDALDLDKDGVTVPMELRSFLLDYAPAATFKVSDAVKFFLDEQLDLSTSPPPPPFIAYLERCLKPVDFGGDLAKHWSLYLKNTREWVMENVVSWFHEPLSTSRAFWIKGSGGLGKSIIAAQLVRLAATATRSQRGDFFVGAYFFCQHSDESRNSPRRVINTLSFQLSQSIPEFQSALNDSGDLKMISSLASGAEGTLDDAFEGLLASPLRKALSRWPADRRVCIVLDALDELHEGTSRSQLLTLVGRGLASLPIQARVIVTSRPERDIEAHLSLLSPFVLDKYEARQLDDLRMFARTKVIEETTLRYLGEEEKEQVVDALISRADGVFLALRFCYEHLVAVEKEKERKGELEIEEELDQEIQPNDRILTLLDVHDMPSEMIDSTYSSSLERVFSRIENIGGGECTVLKDALRQTLATLICAKRPLPSSEISDFCAGERQQDDLLTEKLLNALSLLFTCHCGGAVEPLHKTVYDFLLDESRSGPYCVRSCDGHVILSRSCLRILSDYLLTYPVKPADALELSEAEKYALEFGHVHLAQAASDGGDDGGRGVSDSISAWNDVFLTERRANSTESTTATQYEVSGKVATEASFLWISIQARESRNPQLAVELRALSDALGDDLMHRDLKSFVKCTAWLLGLFFNPRYDKVNFGISSASAFRALLANVPVTSEWFESPAKKACLDAYEFSFLCEKTFPPVTNMNPCFLELRGHSTAVNSVAFSAGSDIILSGGADGTVMQWCGISGDFIKCFFGHTDAVNKVLVFRDGFRVISCSDDSRCIIWDLKTGTSRSILNGRHTSGVNCVDLSPDESLVVSAGADQHLVLWDSETGNPLQTIVGHRHAVTAVKFCPVDDGRRLASGSEDGTVMVWETMTASCLFTFEGHHGAGVTDLAFRPTDGELLVSGSRDKTIRVWDVAAAKNGGHCLWVLKGHFVSVTSVTWCTDGSRFVSGGFDKAVKLWGEVAGDGGYEMVQSFVGHVGGVTAVALNDDGTIIASAALDHKVKLWNTGSAASAKLQQQQEQPHNSYGHTQFVRSVKFSKDGSKVLTSSDDRSVKVWRVDTSECLGTLTGHKGQVTGAVFGCGSRSGSCFETVFSSSEDKTVREWDLKDDGAVCVRTLVDEDEKESGGMTSVACNARGIVAAGCRDKRVRLWGDRGEKGRVLSGHNGAIFSVDFGGGNALASGGDDGEVRLWDVDSGTCTRVLEGFGGALVKVLFSGKSLFAGTSDVIKVFDVESGDLLSGSIVSFEGSLTSFDVSQSGDELVLGTYDRDVELWDAVEAEARVFTGLQRRIFRGESDCVEEVAESDTDRKKEENEEEEYKAAFVLKGHGGWVNAVAFSHDGANIATASRDKTTKVWRR